MNILDVLQRAQEVCATCGVRQANLLLCPCRLVHYCSTPCQVQHWKVHQQVCNKGVRTSTADKRPPVKHCYYCGRASHHIRGCQCGGAVYCDAQCQAKHWGEHRRNCSTWNVDGEEAAAAATQAAATRDPRIMRVRRKDAEVQTEPSLFEEAARLGAIDWRRATSTYISTQRPLPPGGQRGTEDADHGAFSLLDASAAESAIVQHRRVSTTIGPHGDEHNSASMDRNALHLLGVGADGLYNSVIMTHTHTSSDKGDVQGGEDPEDGASHTPLPGALDVRDIPQQPHVFVEMDPMGKTPPSGFEFSGMLPTGGGDLSIRTETMRGSRTTPASMSNSESGGGRGPSVTTTGTATSRVLAAHRAQRDRQSSGAADGDEQAVAARMHMLEKISPAVNPLNIDDVHASGALGSDLPPPAGAVSSTSFRRVATTSSGHPRRRESDSVVDALQPTASFVQHNLSPSNPLARKGTVMSSVLSGAAAHLSRSRSGASGVFGTSTSRMFVMDAKAAQQQREWDEALEDLSLDEEDDRLQIANDRLNQLAVMENVVKRFLFIEAAKALGVEEEVARLDLLMQYNLWLRSSEVVSFRRFKKS